MTDLDWIRLARNEAKTDAERVRDAAPMLLETLCRLVSDLNGNSGANVDYEYALDAIERALGQRKAEGRG